jgi:hypothetical protein
VPRPHDLETPPHGPPGRPVLARVLEIVRKDFAIGVALLVVAASLLVGPWMAFGRHPTLMVAGGVLTAAAIVGFLVVVRAITARWKQ